MRGIPWQTLLDALKETITNIKILHFGSKISIINFSRKSFIEFQREDPDKICIDKLTFQGNRTNFENPLSQVLEILK